MKLDIAAIRAWASATQAHDELRDEVEGWMKAEGLAGRFRQAAHAPMWKKYEAAIEVAAGQNITGGGVLLLCDRVEALERALTDICEQLAQNVDHDSELAKQLARVALEGT